MSLVALASSRLGTAVLDVLVDHGHRAVFRTDGAYVKVEAGGRRARREVMGLRAASGAGIPVPTLRTVDLREPAILVIAEAPGSPLGNRSPDAAWANAGAMLRALHEAPVPADATPFDWKPGGWAHFVRWWRDHELETARTAGWLTAGVADRLRRLTEAAFASLDRPRRLLHGDCQPAHVFVDDRAEVVAVIDWGDAATGDPWWDLAVLTAHEPARLPAVLEGYGDDVDSHLIRAYRALRLLGSASWMAEHRFDPTRDIDAAVAMASDRGGP